MFVAASLIATVISAFALYYSVRGSRELGTAVRDRQVPDHIWDELKSAIPKADYNYLRATNKYMSSSPEDMISRLSYIGAAHDPGDPKQVRIAILELRLAEMHDDLRSLASKTPSDTHIIWVCLSSVATVSSLVALIFYLLQGGLHAATA